MRLATFSFNSYEEREKAANDIYYNCNGYDGYEARNYDGHYILKKNKGGYNGTIES
jgi:hypothetical protein